jgi:hypothetical protein
MSKDYAASFINVGEDGKAEFNRDEVSNVAKTLGYKDTEDGSAVDAWAKDLGKTTEELLTEIEENVRTNIETNTKTYSRLNRVLGKASNEISEFGKNSNISTQNSVGLTNKIVDIVGSGGVEGGTEIKELLDQVFIESEDQANEIASVLQSINWTSSGDWESLSTTLETMGIEAPKSLNALINKVQTLGIVVETINLDKITNNI